MSRWRRIGWGAALLVAATAHAAEPPGDSVYRLSAPLSDQAGVATVLHRYRGHPVLVSMFYGSCPHVCPMLISTIQRLERELPEAQRGRLRVLMVSFDPQRDTPEQLAELAARHRVDLARWTFARPDAAGARKLAALLDIQYRGLPYGAFNHSTVVTLLDGEGRIRARTDSMLRLDPAFVALLRDATARGP